MSRGRRKISTEEIAWAIATASLLFTVPFVGASSVLYEQYCTHGCNVIFHDSITTEDYSNFVVEPSWNNRRMSITVLISGSGSNLQALLDAQKSSVLKGQITQVISSSEDAFGLQRAASFSIPAKVHALKHYYKGTSKDDKDLRRERRELFNKDLANLLIYGNISASQDATYVKPDLVVCAGWMLILSPSVLTPLANAGISIINLHPALPGAFDGTHAIERAWKAGQSGEISKGGVMIHKVIAQVDRGEPVLVKEIDLERDQSLEEYEAIVHSVEHEAIVEGTNIVLKELSLA